MKNKIDEQIKVKSNRFIQTLVIVGLGAFVLMLLIALYVLSFVQSKHQSNQEMSDSSSFLILSFDEMVLHEQNIMRAILDVSNNDRMKLENHEFDQDTIAVMLKLDEYSLKDEAEQRLSEYRLIEEKGLRWREQWITNKKNLKQQVIAIRQELGDFSSLAEQWQGQERLEQAVMLNSALKDNETTTFSNKFETITEQFQVVSALSEVRRELSDFNVVFEQLLTVNNEEHLEDYLRNEFRPILLRLNSRLNQLSLLHDKRKTEMTAKMDTMIDLMLGQHFLISEEIQLDHLDVSGLYEMIGNRIDLMKQREELARESQVIDLSFAKMQKNVISTINKKREQNFKLANSSFRWGWRWMVLIGLFGGGICSVMIFRIAGVIKSQISTLTDAHNQLEIQSQDLEAKNLSLAQEVLVREKAEKEVGKSRGFLQDIIDAIPDSITVIDNQYKVQLANKAARLQTSLQFLEGEKCHDVSYGYEKPCNEYGKNCPIEKAKSSLKEEIVEHSRKLSDDSIVYFEIRVIPIINSYGEVDQFVEVSRDVTTEKLSRIALEESEVRFRTLFEANSDSVIILDQDNNVYCNEATLSIYGFNTKEEFCSNYPPDLSPARQPNGMESKTLAEQYINEAIEKGSCHYEWVHQKPDGTLFNADILLNAIGFGEEGSLIIQAVVRDVTERKQMEKELRENNKRLRRILDTAATAVFEVDPEGTITSINREFTDITGFTEEDIVGQNCVILEGDSCTSKCGLFSEETPNVIYGKQCTIKGKNKKSISILKNCSVAYDENGKITGGLESFIDVTELVDAREKAEAASRAKAEFLANMSHEIRTPMNGILGMNGLLLDTDLTAEQSDYAIRSQVCAESLLNLINDILDFSKVESGKLEFEIIDFSLYTTIDDLNDILSVRPQEKGIEYICNIEPDVPFNLKGDPGRLRQVLTNLVGNAVKFTEKGEIVLHVKALEQNDERTRLLFEVTDTGIGIPEDKLHELFTPFTQADSTITRRFGGTGLGLSICHRLVEKMHGKIGVKSEVGVGSTFWFEAEFDLQTEEKETEFIELPKDIHDLHILIVDDNETNRYLLNRQLKAWHCRPEEASNAREALEKLQQANKVNDPFTIALLDMQMPITDGITLGVRIKDNPQIQSTQLVMMTSMGMRGDTKKLKELGFSAYLNKPVKQSDLYGCIATLHGTRLGERSSQDDTIITRHTLREQNTKRGRVLLVEDNATNLLLGTKLLEQLGMRVDGANNGIEAIEALKYFPYDVVFMDIQMPEMDGLEATRVIRSSDSSVLNNEIPIVAMTAHAMSGDREMCIKAGMNDYVTKPIQKDDLRKVLDYYLKEQLRGAGKRAPQQPSGENKKDPSEKLLCQWNDNDPNKINVLQVFFTDSQEKLNQLKDAFSKESNEQTLKMATGLRKNALTVGAVKMAQLARSIEREENNLGQEFIRRTITDLEDHFLKLKKDYQYIIDKPKSG